VQVEALRLSDHPPKESYWLSMIQKKPKWNGEFHGGRPRPTGAVVQFKKKKSKLPVTVAERSKACTVFARSEPGIVGSNLTQVIMFSVCVCTFFCVCVQVEALRRTDHPPKGSYRQSKI
jgi:hypothetical protein